MNISEIIFSGVLTLIIFIIIFLFLKVDKLEKISYFHWWTYFKKIVIIHKLIWACGLLFLVYSWMRPNLVKKY